MAILDRARIGSVALVRGGLDLGAMRIGYCGSATIDGPRLRRALVAACEWAQRPRADLPSASLGERLADRYHRVLGNEVEVVLHQPGGLVQNDHGRSRG